MKIKKILGLVQILLFAWMLFLVIPSQAINAASSVGIGDVGYVETRDVANGVNLEYVMSTNNNGEQKTHTVEIEKGALTPYVTYGAYVFGGEKLTSMISQAETATGKKVIAAINGDFYDTSNGNPIGSMIIDGKFVSSGSSMGSWPALGFKADGSVIYGTPSVSMKLNDGSSNLTINYLNIERKTNATAVFMYTDDFGSTTKGTTPGTEVVLNVNSGEMKLGSAITATVESINGSNTSIPSGKIVLATASTKLANLTVGQNVTINVTDNKANEGWSDVVQSVGFNAVLAENGVLTSVTDSDTAVHPRTAIGIKADGTLVLFQVDGRQPGWSNGLSYKQIAEYLVNEKDCKTVVNLDGGGSSTIAVRLPGNEEPEVLNSPSDGGERSNANAIFFFENDTPDTNKTVAHLHAYPNNLVILEGAKTTLDVKATDNNYFPVDTPTNLSYQASSGIGIIDQSGNFTATSGSATGTITISSGSVSTTVNVTVVNSVTNIVADKTYLSIAPGDKVEFQLTASKDGMPITCSNSSFTWSLSSPVLGTITNGVYQSTNSSTAGSIYVSYKGFKITIPVEVGKQPKMISTFEDVVMGKDWSSTIENPGNGGKGSVSINTDERFVKFGNKSLRIDYDFTGAKGTTSVTAFPMGANYVLEGYPTHIGMWVYGDMGGTNIRIMVIAGGSTQYISFIPDIVTWDGWQYIEAEIPKGLPTPLVVRYPIRVMSVSGKVKTAGTLYFDNIRAVYGFRNDDVLEPQIKSYAPLDGTTVQSKEPTMSMTVWDKPDINNVVTGINKDSVKVWVNDELMNNVLLADNPDGSITINYTPSALTILRSGPQIVKMRVEDNYGNITTKQWQYYVAGEYVGVSGTVPDKTEILAGDVFNYVVSANSYTNFEKLDATLNFNNKALELKTITKLDSNITLSAYSIADINATGKVTLSATGMNNLTQPEDKQLLKFTFATKEGFSGNSDTNIVFSDVYVKDSRYTTPTKFLLPSYEVKVNYPYLLTYITSTVGHDITFKVTDIDMNPVQNASFQVTGQSINLTGVTDENGYATFSQFKDLAANSVFYIKAVKGQYFSESIKVTMVNSLGSATPFQVVVGPGLDVSTSVNVSWQTDLSTGASVVQYRKVGTTEWQEVTQGLVQPIHVVDNSIMKEYLSHIVTLTGLTPNTSYEYCVGSQDHMSSTFTFKTAPSDDISFIALGDPQNTSTSGYNVTKSLIDAALLEDPNASMMLISGDVVDDVNMYSQWSAFESVLKSYTSSRIVVAASGNHDVIRDYGDPFTNTFVGPNNGLDNVLGANYFFEAGSAAIAIIDTETPSQYEAEAQWLKEKMDATSKKFKIVLMHRSPYAANYDEAYIRDFWPGVFDQAKIDLVLSGHDHVYNSTNMYNGRKTSDNYGTTYVSLGSSGTKFYNSNNLEERPWIDFLYDEDNPVYSNVKIEGNVLTLESFALVNGVSESINKIVIDKDANKASTINITDGVHAILPGNDYQFVAELKDATGANFNGTVSWKLSEEVEGVSIVNGKLVVANNFDSTIDIQVVAYYESVEATYDVKIVGHIPTPSEVLDELYNAQDSYLAGIFQ